MRSNGPMKGLRSNGPMKGLRSNGPMKGLRSNGPMKGLDKENEQTDKEIINSLITRGEHIIHNFNLLVRYVTIV